MRANTSTAHQAGNRAYPVTRLVSVSGAMDPAAPRNAGQQAAAGGFFWLDLEGVGADLLGQFGRSLRLDPSVMAKTGDTGQPPGMAAGTVRAAQRPSLTAGGIVQGLVSAAGGLAPDAAAIPVRILYTGKFLLTVHSGPCPALEQARHRYDGLRDEGMADSPLVLFLVLDDLAGSFEEQFLALDARLDEIQLELLTSSSRGAQAEVLAIRRRLADAGQALGWYTGDLDDLNTAGVAQLPGMSPAAQAHLGRHRQRIIRLTEAARPRSRRQARRCRGR